MSRLKLLSLQVLVAVVGLGLWQFFASVPVFGRMWLPPFFFSNPVDVFSQIVHWFATGTIWKKRSRWPTVSSSCRRDQVRASSVTGAYHCRGHATFPKSGWKRNFTRFTVRYGVF